MAVLLCVEPPRSPPHAIAVIAVVLLEDVIYSQIAQLM